MSQFVKAQLGPKNSVIYADDAGRYYRYSGGTWAWRNHNPGNLVPGNVSKRNNQIGTTKKFAIFPDYETGHKALLDCLQTTFSDATIDDLVKAYAPEKDGNNVKRYTKFLRDKTGVFDNKKVKNFSSAEFDRLWRAIEQMEGYKEGTIVEILPIIEVHKDSGGIYGYNVKKQGWLSLQECIVLVKEEILDLIICSSRLRHTYLRARAGSIVNGSLIKLVVSDPDQGV